MPAEAEHIHPPAPTRSAYDLVVIGAGVIGLSCAWRAAQAGLSVLVFERDAPGAGATGVAAGMLAPITEADFGEEALLELNLRGRGLWGGFAAELEELTGMASGYADGGALVVAADRDDREELHRLHDFQRRLGLDATWLTTRECRALEPGLAPRVGGAILAPQDGQVNPRAVVRALTAALRSAGGELICAAEVTSLETAGGRVTGVRADGDRSAAASAVLVAAGAWSNGGGLASGCGAPALRPVKGQLLELRVRRGHLPPAERLIRTPRCYIVTRGGSGEGAAGHRVVIGATMEEQGFDTSVTAEGVFGLLEAAREVLPEVGELELLSARAGLRPSTPDNAPAIGRGGPDGLLWATGHHRNGVLLAPLTARLIVDLLRGGPTPPELHAFDPDRFDSLRVV
ncbi:MAG: glycine oxidase ThiO [Thermoleophilaceae bacterium]|nr:glycine oxidase ThiO [Thermoleophilaceae bacterium]